MPPLSPPLLDLVLRGLPIGLRPGMVANAGESFGIAASCRHR
jgi:hypothetical protein